MKINTLIVDIFGIGVKKDLSSQEIKNVRLLNFCCVAWILLNILFIIEDIFVHYPDLTHSLLFASTVLFLVLVFFFQKRYYYVAAKILFICLSIIYYMVLAIYLEPGAFLEYLLLFIPIFSLVFFNNYWVSLFVLLLSYILFIYTMMFFGHYNGHRILYTGNLGLFLGIYIAFAYFKELNIRSEKSLEEKHNQAIVSRKKIEQQKKELEELNKFQSHFWVNLSHEIRTPLTLIKGSSAKLTTEKNDEKLTKYYKSIERNSDRIHILIDNIMDLAKMKSNKLELNFSSVNIIPFCKKVLNTFEPLFSQKKISYNFINQARIDSITCSIDPIFMERALGNLLSNACKFTNEKGHIELILKFNNQVAITVKDTGCGIPKEELPDIFNSFYRAKSNINNAGGTGIGLSFTKEVIDIHHGSITAKSIENQGSEFTISLPVSEINCLNDKENTSLPLHIIKNIDIDAKILLIEDNVEMRSYIKSILSDYHITEAVEGNEALQVLSNPPYPDLIVTDYMMPGINGYEFVKNIRKKGLEIPVIVITARIDREAKMDFLRLGLDDYLSKPFNEEELLLRVGHSLKNNKERIQFNELDEKEENVLELKGLDKLSEIIESNIESSMFGVKELADILFISERTLHRKIKSLCGLTPNEFVREVKLQKAMELYKNQEINSTKELAGKVGYTNSGHLAMLFEKRFGKKLDFKSKL